MTALSFFGPRCGEVSRKVRRRQLEQGLRLRQALEPVSAEAAKADVARRRCLDGAYRVAREQDLTAVTGRANPGRRVHGQPDVAAVGQGWTTGIDVHPEPNVGAGRP